MLKLDFTIMPYAHAMKLLEKTNPLAGLNREDELKLVKMNNGVPIFVINWPKAIKPFYMRECEGFPEYVSFFLALYCRCFYVQIFIVRILVRYWMRRLIMVFIIINYWYTGVRC